MEYWAKLWVFQWHLTAADLNPPFTNITFQSRLKRETVLEFSFNHEESYKLLLSTCFTTVSFYVFHHSLRFTFWKTSPSFVYIEAVLALKSVGGSTRATAYKWDKKTNEWRLETKIGLEGNQKLDSQDFFSVKLSSHRHFRKCYKPSSKSFLEII